MQVTRTFIAGVSDVGTDSRLTNKAMLEACSNMANIHGKTVGQGSDTKNEFNIGWVVLNWKLEVYSRPSVCEEYTVTTWSSCSDQLRASREFLIYREDHTLSARAASVWIAVDLDTHMPRRLLPEYLAPYESEPDRVNFPGYRPAKGKIPNLPVLKRAEMKTTRSMVDCYHHVHNTNYFDFIPEVLPEGIEQNAFNGIEVVYKKEIEPLGSVQIQYMTDEAAAYIVILNESGEHLHALFILK